MSASSRIKDLGLAKLAGRKIDIVGFMDDVLDLAQEFGSIRCSLAGEARLRFELPDLSSCEIEVDGGRAKLRMLCARLSVLCEPTSDGNLSPYGGEGTIEKALPSGNGQSQAPCRWTARFRNTPAEQEFTITPIKEQLAPPSLAMGQRHAVRASTQ